MKNLKALAAAVIALGVLAALVIGGLGVSASPSPDSNEVKGTLTAVNVADLLVTVDNRDFAVLPTVTVTVEHGGRIPFEQLPDYIGSRVELKLNANGAVYRIQVKGRRDDGDGNGNGDGNGSGDRDRSGRKEIKGTLQSVNTGSWTVTVNGTSYTVLSNATIKVEHQGAIPFAKLSDYIGRRVELKLNADGLVYKIEVKGQDGEGGNDD